jgi:hypothetical protein
MGGWTFGLISSREHRTEVKVRYAAMRRHFRGGIQKYVKALTAGPSANGPPSG